MLAPDSELPSSGAILSDCQGYRYLLWRSLPPDLLREDLGAILFVMLNPSTADAKKPDATVRKLCAYAQRWGYTRLWAVNLYALRSRHPTALLDAEDPIGVQTDAYIRTAVDRSSAVVVGWGDGPRGLSLDRRAEQVLALLPNPTALAVTRAGRPGHPLYLPGSATPTPYQKAA